MLKKRREENTDKDGQRTIWTYSEAGKIESFKEFSPANLLVLERSYDVNGTESSCAGYNESGVRLFANEYDSRGQMTKQTKWNENGRLTAITHYLNSYRHGTVELFSDDTGALISKRNYLYDRRDGLCEDYYEDPGHETIKERAFFKSGQIEGLYTRFFKNGRVEETGMIEEGRSQGARTQFYETGIFRCIHRFSGGEMHGDLEDFYEDGKIQRRLPMVNGKPHGLEQNFNTHGQVTSQSAHINGESTGDLSKVQSATASNEPVELFHSNGQLQSRHALKNGIRNGSYEIFRSTGVKRESGVYQNDVRAGTISYFGEDGKLVETACYLEGRLDGPKTKFYPSGEIASIETYSRMLFMGFRNYDEKGQLKESTELEENGIGIKRLYADSGEMIRETEVRSNYSRQRQINHGFDRIYELSTQGSGGLTSESHYINGLQHGPSRYYGANGILSSVQNFDSGRLKTTSHCNARGDVYRVITYFEDGKIAQDRIVGEADLPGPTSAPADGAAALVKGTMIASYEVIRSIGHGGMGDVVLAYEKALDRKVAIKLIRGKTDSEARVRFDAEGRALARIKHQNIVSVFQVSEDRGLPFMVMEYVEGWPLNALLGQGLLGFNEQISLFRQMVDGMIAAHAMGVLHRDLKPANIIVSKTLGLKIIDFGISKILAEDAGLTKPNTVIGTVRYMAPEAALGQTASAQSDIYSLGIILFEMLTGDTPFRGANQLETIELIKTAPVVFPAGISEILPDPLKKLVICMTAKISKNRPENLQQVLRELDAVSFNHLPEEFKTPMRPELEIANLEEARRILKEKGHSASEFSLILNLASRIQQKMIADLDRTQPLNVVEDFVISPEALSQATQRYAIAKREYAANPKTVNDG